MLKGSLVALVTPMLKNGEIDVVAFKKLIDFHIQEHSDALVVVGTTGESATVNFDEHYQLIEIAVQHAQKRIPIIAGTGANATQEAISLTQAAQQLGADACLLVTPYYNKPTQEGLYRHFMSIADSVDIPQILYNVPSRTGSDLSNNTILRLSTHPHIVGVKDATGDITRGYELILRSPADFALYSGDDSSALAFLLLGGQGVISVTANIAPSLMHSLCVAVQAGDFAEARRINAQLFTLHQHLFVEANPIAVKWLLAEMGLIEHGIRLPLTPLDVSYHSLLREAARAVNIHLK